MVAALDKVTVRGDACACQNERPVTAVTTHDVDPRQELLGRIRTPQASINTYVRKKQDRRGLVANISIISSSIAAALMLGPGVAGAPFVETVQKGLGFQKDSSVGLMLLRLADCERRSGDFCQSEQIQRYD